MFTVKKVITFEQYCPQGHTPPSNPWPQSNHGARFCDFCGSFLEERRLTFDAPYCAECNNPVGPGWNHCRYCGQEK